MKKTILFSIILQWMIISPSFASNNPGEDKNPQAIKSVEINADVAVVLGLFGSTQAFADGSADFMEQIIITHTGSHLVISSVKNRNLKNKGVIYISAESLADIRINSDAYVQSSGALESPALNILVNGACQIMIANKGELNLVPSSYYNFEYQSKEFFQPLTFYRSRKK